MTFTESNQKHRDQLQSQVRSMIRHKVAVEVILEDEAVEELMDLAVAVDLLPVTTVEEQDIMLGIARTLLQPASIVSLMTIP